MRNRILILVQLLVWTAIAAHGANINPDKARAAAAGFLTSNGSFKASTPASTLRLVHSEASSVDARLNDYYVFNTGDNSRYVIVAGDDRAETILAYGEGAVDMGNLPEGMQFLLELYKGQLDYLHAHPEYVVNKAPRYASSSVSPLLSTKWNQGEPYNCMCPMDNGKRSVTGCAATSMSMVFHFWQYPERINTTIPGYTTKTKHIEVEALSPTSFDWSYMLNSYTNGSYNNVQSNAVGKLMRYVGQAEKMDYTSQSSGASIVNMLNTVMLFGYDQDAYVHMKMDDETGDVYFNDEEWAANLQYELNAGRPIVYVGNSADGSGHAFNVDGYDAARDAFHVNFGWGGNYNGYYVLNAFDGAGSVYNLYQCYFSNLQPPVTTPTIKMLTDRIYIYGYTHTETVNYFSVKGSSLINDVNITLNDQSGSFTITKTHLSLDEVKEGFHVPVIYNPLFPGTQTATVTLTSEGAQPVTLTLIGRATMEKHDPVMLQPIQLSGSSFKAQWQDSTPSSNVKYYRMELNYWPPTKLLLEQSFEHITAGAGTTDVSLSLDEYTSVPGWTGFRVYTGNGYLSIGSDVFSGRLTTPPLDVSDSNGQLTVRITAKCPDIMLMSNLTVSFGEYDTTIVITPNGYENVVSLPCGTSGTETVTFSKKVKGQSVMLHKVTIVAGNDVYDINPDEATVYGNIRGKSFDVKGVEPGNYAMRVQAVYIDNTVSQWSEYQRWQLNAISGDVNLDQEVNIADINMAINMIIDDNHDSVGDVNKDGEINIADINAIIDIILGK